METTVRIDKVLRNRSKMMFYVRTGELLSKGEGVRVVAILCPVKADENGNDS